MYPPDDMTTQAIDLTLALRFANGSLTEFYDADEGRVRETLPLLAAPRLFAQPHLLLASQDCASLIPGKGIDMILARTAGPLPLKFPLDLPAGQFDLVERPEGWPASQSPAIENRDGPSRRRNSRLEIHTFGGWIVKLDVVAIFHGNAQDELQFFSQLPNMPSIPFRLAEGGFGLINTVNIMRVSAWPKPDMLPGIALPLELRR